MNVYIETRKHVGIDTTVELSDECSIHKILFFHLHGISVGDAGSCIGCELLSKFTATFPIYWWPIEVKIHTALHIEPEPMRFYGPFSVNFSRLLLFASPCVYAWVFLLLLFLNCCFILFHFNFSFLLCRYHCKLRVYMCMRMPYAHPHLPNDEHTPS